MPLLALELNCSTAPALVKKWTDTMKGIREMKEAYEGLSELMDEETLKRWKEEEVEAMGNRGDFMKIYEIKFDKGGHPYIKLDSSVLIKNLAPTMAEIGLALTEKENSNSLESGTIAWLTTGINLEQMQCVPLTNM